MKPKKGLTVGRCVNRARRYIAKYGICFLWFDVVGSVKRFPDSQQLRHKLVMMIKDLNSKFADYFPKSDLMTRGGKFEKGFPGIMLRDFSYTGINNAEIIREIVKYQKEKYPDISLYWGVADGYTKEDWK